MTTLTGNVFDGNFRNFRDQPSSSNILDFFLLNFEGSKSREMRSSFMRTFPKHILIFSV